MSRPGDTGPYAAWNVKIVRTEENASEGQRSPRRSRNPWKPSSAQVFLSRLSRQRNRRAKQARLDAIWRKIEARRARGWRQNLGGKWVSPSEARARAAEERARRAHVRSVWDGGIGRALP
jgi:hypothetical protein